MLARPSSRTASIAVCRTKPGHHENTRFIELFFAGGPEVRIINRKGFQVDNVLQFPWGSPAVDLLMGIWYRGAKKKKNCFLLPLEWKILSKSHGPKSHSNNAVTSEPWRRREASHRLRSLLASRSQLWPKPSPNWKTKQALVLFRRLHARGMELTAQGTEFLRYAEQLLVYANQMDVAVADIAAHRMGTLRLGCFQSIAPFYLARILREYPIDNPGCCA